MSVISDYNEMTVEELTVINEMLHIGFVCDNGSITGTEVGEIDG